MVAPQMPDIFLQEFKSRVTADKAQIATTHDLLPLFVLPGLITGCAEIYSQIRLSRVNNQCLVILQREL
jgi:hypothetical protein